MPARLVSTHEAMATTFEIVIAHDDAAYARQAAGEAFAELDRIEAHLSRFAEGSDIFRINRLRQGEATHVHLDTFECLRVAEQVRLDTAGAFDVAYASDIAAGHSGFAPGAPTLPLPPPWQGGECLNPSPSQGEGRVRVGLQGMVTPRFEFNEENHSVRVLAEGVRLDLGGIGKGFALDRMGGLLREWEIRSALLCASTSTLLALDPPPGEEGWAAQLGPEDTPQRLALVNQALSASGMAVKGSHIIDPRAGRPAEGRFRARALAPTAALADALSTAFMIMGDGEVRSYCRRYPGISAWVLGSSTGACATIP